MLALRELIRMLSGWNTVAGSSRCQWFGPSVLALLISRYPQMSSGRRATLRRRYSKPVRGETEFVEVVTDLPFPDDSPVGCDLVDSLVHDDAWAERRNFARDRHQNEPVAVREQFPVVVLASRAAGRFGAPLPELLPRPRQLADGAVSVDAAGRIVHLGQLDTDVADASPVEGRVDDAGRNAGIRPLLGVPHRLRSISRVTPSAPL